jgi:large subunit ribosomal protein L25
MEAIELKAEARTVVGRHVKNLRQQGLVPIVLYGKGLETQSLQVDAKSLSKVLAIAGSHQLINLQVGNQRSQLTLARDIQRDPIQRGYLHVDFYAVKMDEKVTAKVPLVIIGEAPAVGDLGGILTHGLDEVEIECLPANLISSIEVDVSSLAEFNDTIIVADLTLPETITVLSDPESMVVKIEPPRVAAEEVEEEEAAVVSAEPEVLTASKREADSE